MMDFARVQIVAAVVLSSLAMSVAASAQTPEEPPGERTAASEAEQIDQPTDFEKTLPQSEQTPVRWDDSWEKMRGWQYPVTAGLLGFGFTARFAIRDPEPTWASVSDFEQTLVDLVAIREDPARENLREFNDMTFYGAMAYRVIDSGLLPVFMHDSSEVAWQMSWIDAQSFGVVAAVLWGTQIYVGRIRPTSNNCDDPDRLGHLCDEENSDFARSFIAGHTATAVTAAGLTCVHHDQMPLYGGGLDGLACGIMVTNAAVNAITRTMVELHYPSDVLMGTVLGLTAGWILPKALHYGWGEDERDPAETAGLPEAQDDRAATFSVSPTIVDDRPGMMLLGRF